MNLKEKTTVTKGSKEHMCAIVLKKRGGGERGSLFKDVHGLHVHLFVCCCCFFFQWTKKKTQCEKKKKGR